MPIISAFFGIVIRMFYREHEPPHFHAEYQGQQAKFDFDGKGLKPDLPGGPGDAGIDAAVRALAPVRAAARGRR